jgi:predicted nucleotidyltransferase
LLVSLFKQPDRRFYLRELVRLVGTGQGSVQRELGNLVAAGIVTRQAQDGRIYFQANAACPISPELRSMVLKTDGLVHLLRDALTPLSEICLAFVHGSMASGQEQPESDVDLVVIGDVSFRDVVRALGPAQKKVGREINPTVYPEAEFSKKVRKKHHFVTTLLDRPRLYVIGNEDELGKLAGKRLARRASNQ